MSSISADSSGHSALSTSSNRTFHDHGVSNPMRGAEPRSLFQTCVELKSRLQRIPEIVEIFSKENNPDNADDPSSRLQDPVTELWRHFRLGSTLCVLINAFDPPERLPIITEENPNLNACKRCVYKFLTACQSQLSVPSDNLFSITELYQNDTNGFVKVTRTVSLVLDKLQGPFNPAESATSLPLFNTAPTNNRSKVTQELIVTERKYVHDLEILQDYMRALRKQEVIPADDVHMIFANLDALVDFQRRFLIGLETKLQLLPEKQRLGWFFSRMESSFQEVYEPYCSNHSAASDLVMELAPQLSKLSHIVDPSYELFSMLIKPIQRICKYPLLLRELIKYTEPASLEYTELQEGLSSIVGVVDRINESRRRQENHSTIMDLEKRIDDWKGFSLSSFGNLLLQDQFVVFKGDIEREYQVYLFEEILLCCKESGSSKKPLKSSTGSRKSKKRSSLQLKGRIFIGNLENVNILSATREYTLQVTWKGDLRDDSLVMRCRNEEHLRQWHSTMSRLIELHQQGQYMDGLYESFARQQISNTEFVSMQNSGFNRQSGTDDYSDTTENEEAFDTENVYSSFSMSRNASQTSQRSRSTTNDSNVSLKQTLPWPSRKVSGPLNAPYPNSRSTSAKGGQEVHVSQIGSAQMLRSNSRERPGLVGPPMRALTQPRMPPGMLRNRERSASTPNIHHRENNNHITREPAQMVGAGNSSASHSAVDLRPSTSSSSSPVSMPHLRLQVVYRDDTLLIMVPSDLDFHQLAERVFKKVRLCCQVADTKKLRLRYMDEDGDYITMVSDEDVALALEQWTCAQGYAARVYVD